MSSSIKKKIPRHHEIRRFITMFTRTRQLPIKCIKLKITHVKRKSLRNFTSVPLMQRFPKCGARVVFLRGWRVVSKKNFF